MSADKVLSAVVDITESRNQEGLEKSLVAAIGEQVRMLRLIFCRISSISSGQHRFRQQTLMRTVVLERRHEGGVVIDTRHHILPATTTEVAAIQSRQPVEEVGEDGLRSWVIPIEVDATVVGLLKLECYLAMSDEDSRFLRGVLSIYTNFLAIVRDNEYDTLTGLYNRKTFDEKISRIIMTYNEQEQPLLDSIEQGKRHYPLGNHWLAAVDIDHFKRINDTFGHLYGDEVLILMANLMRESFREDDLLFRYGGEEFIVVLTPCDRANAESVFERFRAKVADYDFPQVGRITVSIGFVGFGDHDYPKDVVEQADQALYYAKEHGRNRLCHYESLVEQGELHHYDASSVDSVELF
ncbi:GGDEF domain-containing protein [Ectothiorhodospiraceae bacterium BW-2]|nr:GGDEF domain-containing protein [Ectothiorhodospiraceae bacterium BW-2]